jgi:hypothetical protein
MDTQKLLDQWRAFAWEIRKMMIPIVNTETLGTDEVQKAFPLPDPEAIVLLAGIAMTSTYLLEQLAKRKRTCEIVRQIAAQHASWPVLFNGIYPSDEEIIDALGLGKKLPFQQNRKSRIQKDKVYFLVLDLLSKVTEVATLHRLFQAPDCPPELKIDLPDYAPDAALLPEQMNADSLELWWRCVEAELDTTYGPDIYGKHNRQNLVAMLTELTGREPRKINVSFLKELLKDRLKSLACNSNSK